LAFASSSAGLAALAQVETLQFAAKKLSTPNAPCAAGAEIATTAHATVPRSKLRALNLMLSSS